MPSERYSAIMDDELDPVAQTARWTAAARARETERPDRLFADPLAAHLAGAVGFAILDREPAEVRANPYLPIRTRVLDDWLSHCVADLAVTQVVLLGAGFDCRAYRMPWPEGVVLWELDVPELLHLKARLLAAAGAAPRCERRVVAVDLTSDEWPTYLVRAGFVAEVGSVWLAEGLWAYWPARAVERAMQDIAELAAPASHLLTDFVSQDFLESPWTASYLRLLEERGTPWRFGTNQPEALLAAHGWRAEAVLQPGEPGAAFGRWPYPVAPRSVPGLPRSFLVHATREPENLQED